MHTRDTSIIRYAVYMHSDDDNIQVQCIFIVDGEMFPLKIYQTSIFVVNGCHVYIYMYIYECAFDALCS